MARNSKNIIRLVENTDIRNQFDEPYDILHCSKIECTITLFTKAMWNKYDSHCMTHTIHTLQLPQTFAYWQFKTDCPEMSCPVQYQYICSRWWYYVIITSSWRHRRYYSSFIAHPFFRNFQKAYFCTDWNSWLVQKWFFKILFPYFPFSLIIADS